MNKSKYIYGVSSKYAFGKWTHWIYVFLTKAAAVEWLNAEQRDFRSREILKNKTAAIKLVGRKAITEAEEHAAENEYVYAK